MISHICNICTYKYIWKYVLVRCSSVETVFIIFVNIYHQCMCCTSINKKAYLLRKSVYSACLISPVLIMMVWKHCRSMAQSRQSVAALMVAVLLQLYKIASSPNTLPGAIVLRYLFSRETSTLPSENKNIELESKQKEKMALLIT